MSTTLETFKASQLRASTKKPGAMKMGEIVVMCDALMCIGIVCHHVYHGYEHGMSTHLQKRIAWIQRTSGLSLAQSNRVLGAWHKWTSWRDKGSEIPTLSQVQSFLLDAAIGSI